MSARDTRSENMTGASRPSWARVARLTIPPLVIAISAFALVQSTSARFSDRATVGTSTLSVKASNPEETEATPDSSDSNAAAPVDAGAGDGALGVAAPPADSSGGQGDSGPGSSGSGEAAPSGNEPPPPPPPPPADPPGESPGGSAGTPPESEVATGP